MLHDRQILRRVFGRQNKRRRVGGNRRRAIGLGSIRNSWGGSGFGTAIGLGSIRNSWGGSGFGRAIGFGSSGRAIGLVRIRRRGRRTRIRKRGKRRTRGGIPASDPNENVALFFLRE